MAAVEWNEVLSHPFHQCSPFFKVVDAQGNVIDARRSRHRRERNSTFYQVDEWLAVRVQPRTIDAEGGTWTVTEAGDS
jgi:hypothetical protein